MKTAEEWLHRELNSNWTDEKFEEEVEFVRAIQADALEAAALLSVAWPGDDTYGDPYQALADAIRKLKERA